MNDIKNRKVKIFLASIFLIVGLVLILNTFLLNIFGMIIDRGYFIPKESSAFSFRCLMMNGGSGEWWVYGEDKRNYYFNGDHEYKTGYVVFPKSEISLCKGFNAQDYSTWCSAYKINSEVPRNGNSIRAYPK